MQYIKINKRVVEKIKEYNSISLQFWSIQDIKYFYSKKEYKTYRKYKHLFNNKHIIEQKGKI